MMQLKGFNSERGHSGDEQSRVAVVAFSAGIDNRVTTSEKLVGRAARRTGAQTQTANNLK
ncbi:hypothetical protein [Rhodopirellula europaea]|uniref:Uncharacterized protein n=1 Tax=Rhodopirellula europaea 6C TaxID=1263867 RepID=M2B4X9_9BACT|nr:hypothetical protein [Rhodopirellula europaea]EMB17269.1 hypothetical protein RE6C_01807 [Rhodopirellula europaea 6C]